MGFREATGIKFADFQVRGQQLAEEAIKQLTVPIR